MAGVGELPVSGRSLNGSGVAVRKRPVLVRKVELPRRNGVPFCNPNEAVVNCASRGEGFCPTRRCANTIGGRLGLRSGTLLDGPRLLGGCMRSVSACGFRSKNFG